MSCSDAGLQLATVYRNSVDADMVRFFHCSYLEPFIFDKMKILREDILLVEHNCLKI